MCHVMLCHAMSCYVMLCHAMLVAVVEAIGPHCCHTSTTATYCPGFYALAITDETHAQSVASMDYATPHRCASDRSQVGLWLHSPR